jgi:hypothetical protein
MKMFQPFNLPEQSSIEPRLFRAGPGLLLDIPSCMNIMIAISFIARWMVEILEWSTWGK